MQNAILPVHILHTVYPKKYAHGFYFAVLCCGYTLTDFPLSIRLTSLALWQSNDCPSASKATLMNMDKYFMWIHYERLHNHNKAKHNKTVCTFLGIYCKLLSYNSHCVFTKYKADIMLFVSSKSCIWPALVLTSHCTKHHYKDSHVSVTEIQVTGKWNVCLTASSG